MPYFTEGSPAMVELESMVDKVGIRNVLWALAHIAGAKAEHVATNWQDVLLAKQWMKISGQIQSLVPRIKIDPLADDLTRDRYKTADRVDGYDRDDLGESPDY